MFPSAQAAISVPGHARQTRARVPAGICPVPLRGLSLSQRNKRAASSCWLDAWLGAATLVSAIPRCAGSQPRVDGRPLAGARALSVGDGNGHGGLHVLQQLVLAGLRLVLSVPGAAAVPQRVSARVRRSSKQTSSCGQRVPRRGHRGLHSRLRWVGRL